MLNLRIFRICLSVMLLCSMSGYAKETISEAEKEKMKEELIMEVFYEKFEKNGPSLLCNQKSYIDCYNITPKKCTADIKSVNEKCIKYSREKTETVKDYKIKKNTFGKVYTTCVGVRHAAMYSEIAQELGQCLKSVHIDKDKIRKTLLR